MRNTPGLPNSKDSQLSLCWEHLQRAGRQSILTGQGEERLRPPPRGSNQEAPTRPVCTGVERARSREASTHHRSALREQVPAGVPEGSGQALCLCSGARLGCRDGGTRRPPSAWCPSSQASSPHRSIVDAVTCLSPPGQQGLCPSRRHTVGTEAMAVSRRGSALAEAGHLHQGHDTTWWDSLHTTTGQ